MQIFRKLIIRGRQKQDIQSCKLIRVKARIHFFELTFVFGIPILSIYGI